MCIKLKGSGMTPGQVMAFMTKLGKATGFWGFNQGTQANARKESLTTVWKNLKNNTGILVTDSFWEKDTQFVRSDGKPFNIAVIYNDRSEFAVVTTPALGIVKNYHGRMPLIIGNDQTDKFLVEHECPLSIDDTIIILKKAV